MNDSEIENTENEVIDSDTIVEPTEIELQRNYDHVTTKKGSFLLFITFIFSVSALVLSGYMYYLDHNKKLETKNNGTLWKIPLEQIGKDLTNQITKISSQLTLIKQNNQKLREQLVTIEDQVKQEQAVKKLNLANQGFVKFDDSSIKQQIVILENQLSQQSQAYDELQKKIMDTNQQLSSSIQQLQKDVKTEQALIGKAQQNTTNNYSYDMAESLLESAHIQLNINANVEKAKMLLDKAQEQLNQLPEIRFKNFVVELRNIANDIANIKLPNYKALGQQIDELSSLTSKLEFSQGLVVEKNEPEASWYEKLVVIRKIDEPSKTESSKKDLLVALESFKNHYQTLKIALISQNQYLWQSEISQIESLLNLHFADKSQEAKNKLTKLKAVDLNPGFPDLEIYLQKLKTLNASRSSESN